MVHGNGVSTLCFIDSDHVDCKVIIIFVSKAPILWYSKHQNTVETSTFGSEFCAMKIAVDMIEGFCYKLQMMGIPLTSPTSVFCNNESVVKNNMKAPESTLKKHHNAITYHRACKVKVVRIINVA